MVLGLSWCCSASPRSLRNSTTSSTGNPAKYEKDAPYNIAYVYAFRGDADQAFAWLDKAVEYGDPGPSEIVTENLFDNIRADCHFYARSARRLWIAPVAQWLQRQAIRVLESVTHAQHGLSPRQAAFTTSLLLPATLPPG